MSTRIVLVLFPFALAFAAALLVKGYASVGDGFSAGAVAGLGAALQYACLEHARAAARVGAAWAAPLAITGLLVALGMLLVPAVLGLAPVTHYPRPDQTVHHLGALELHSALVFDLAIAVVVYGALVVTFDRLFPPSTAVRP